mmetsp:Transcript_10130/g.24187  ORF Transcript_10130/g.24187 Transcript_10130/m.24187 type:complete len:119 (-) Transcript_10130:9-365(-)
MTSFHSGFEIWLGFTRELRWVKFGCSFPKILQEFPFHCCTLRSHDIYRILSGIFSDVGGFVVAAVISDVIVLAEGCSETYDLVGESLSVTLHSQSASRMILIHYSFKSSAACVSAISL